MGLIANFAQAASDTFGTAADLEMKRFLSEIEKDRQIALDQARIEAQSAAKEAERSKRTTAIKDGAASIASAKQGLISQEGRAVPTPADMQMAAANYDGTGYDKIVDNQRADVREERAATSAAARDRIETAKLAIKVVRMAVGAEKDRTLDCLVMKPQTKTER
jgi:hypothetical protein